MGCMSSIELCLRLGLIVAIVLGTVFAIRQATNFLAVELMKHLEALPVRKARKVVLVEIGKEPYEEIQNLEWMDDKKKRRAAELVASTYDHVGAIIKHRILARFILFGFYRQVGLAAFIFDRWGASAIKCHDVLEKFLVNRREVLADENAYGGFDYLVNEAKKINQLKGIEWRKNA